MSTMQGQVISPTNGNYQNGNAPIASLGRSGEVLTSALNPQLFTQCYNGNLFSAASTSITPTAAAGTAQTFGLWNRAGNSKLLVPARISVYATTAPTTAGGLALAQHVNMGANIATGAPFSASTNLVPLGMYLGSNHSSTGVCFTAATVGASFEPAVFYPLWGFGTGALTSYAGQTLSTDFNGELILAPGAAIFLVADSEAVGTFTVYLSWYEVSP